MKVRGVSEAITSIDADAVVAGVYADASLPAAAAEIDDVSGGLVTRLFEAGEIRGKTGDLFPLWGIPAVAAGHVLLVGLGDSSQIDRGTLFRAAAAAARQLAGRPRGRVAFFGESGWPDDLHESAVAGAMTGCHGPDIYRAEPNRHPFEELLWSGCEEQTVARGRILGEAIQLARRLVNEPPAEIFPQSFAERARLAAGDCGMEVDVWDERRLEEERAGALLAVAAGSAKPPRLVLLRHAGGGQGAPTLALVGKGVTFDSGGLSLKPNESMKTMKCDMAGAATVLGAMQAIARLKLPINAMGLVGLVENMPGSKAMKLGDVLRARNGRTIEVQNTDAEGRLVLADVLSVAVDQGATRIIDVATLTGSCVVALGRDVAGLMSNEDSWCREIQAAANICGEPAWQLPMFPEFGELIKSDVADIKNVGDGRWGGAITAAKFLEEFVADTPWTHIDVAGPAFLEKPKPWSDAGGSGCFVRTLVEVARRWASA